MISYQYKKKRLFFLNSSFNSDFTLIDAKINEINFDISPFQLYKNNSLKVISFIRDHHQSKPIQIKLKDLIYDSRINYNTDKEAFPTIYSSHTGVECMLNNNYNSLTLLPQQITKFNLKVNDNFNDKNSGLTPEETLINTNNSNIIINQPSQYQINYEPPIKIDKGTYSANFTSNIGGITFLKSPDYTYPILKTNPLVWYKFDSSDLGKDEMNNHNLINNGGTVYNTNDYNKGIGSASFDGTNDYLSKASAFNLNSKDFTISFWIKRTQNGRYDFVFNITNDGVFVANQRLYVGYRDNNKITLGFFGDDLDTTSTYTDAGSWVHLAFTFQTSTKTQKIYRNGIQVATRTATNQLNCQTTRILVGVYETNSLYTKGLLDDFRIYEKELTQLEINELYYGSANRSYPLLKDGNNETINPLVWYKFDNDSTKMLLDSGTSGNNLTNNGATYDSNNFLKGNGSINFDGSKSKYTSLSYIPFHTYINNQGITFSLWVSLTNTGADYRRVFSFFANGSNNNSHYIAMINHIGSKDYYFEVHNGISLNSTGRIITDVEFNKFYHIIWSISNTGVWTIYLNGVLIYSQTKTTSATYLSTNVNNFFSRGADIDTLNFAGNIDDFRIYSQVLTATQVSELYTGRIQIFNPPSFLLGLELEDKELEQDNIASIYR